MDPDNTHRLLRRQLKKYLNVEDPGELTPDMQKFVRDINEAYLDLDADKRLTERSLENSNFELSSAKQKIADSLSQIQNLKKQQDGDYFLTSLLIEPLIVNETKSTNFEIEFFIDQKKHFVFKGKDYQIGGDLCIAKKIILEGKSYIALLNGDAMGKSIQGAGGAIVLGSLFQAILDQTNLIKKATPQAWLKRTYAELNNVFDRFNGRMLVTLLLGLICEESFIFYFINCDHPQPILLRDNKADFFGENLHSKLGTGLEVEKIHINSLKLCSGDTIVIGTDGRDDLLLSDPEEDVKTMNEDFNLILKIVQNVGGNLQRLYEEILTYGSLTDDLSLIRIHVL